MLNQSVREWVSFCVQGQSNWDDDNLLRGAVPQPEDWLRVWSRCLNLLSQRKSEKLPLTEDIISSARLVDTRPLKIEAIQSMETVLSHTVRDEKKH